MIISHSENILGGEIFIADENGFDPSYPENGGFLPKGMYIRLEGSNGGVAYVNAFELENALSIVGQMSVSKADQSEVDSILELLKGKASKNEFDLLYDDVKEKATILDLHLLGDSVKQKASLTEVNELKIQLSNKAEADTVAVLQTLIESKANSDEVEYIKTIITTKANADAVEVINNDLNILKSSVESINDSITAGTLYRRIQQLEATVNEKINNESLVAVNSNITIINQNINELNERITALELNLSKKASSTYVQNQIKQINNAITTLAKRAESFVSKSELAGKAEKNELNATVSKVRSINERLSTLEVSCHENNDIVIEELGKKIGRSEYDSKMEELGISLDSKMNRSSFNSYAYEVDTKINALETDRDSYVSGLNNVVNEFKGDVNQSLYEFESDIYSQLNVISDHSSRINELESKNEEYDSKLKNQWVRVMTPEEYNMLSPVGSILSNGKPNPYAKQANTVYFLTRYGNPIAVYIGEILIAVAEQKGSVGFAYTFPISF